MPDFLALSILNLVALWLLWDYNSPCRHPLTIVYFQTTSFSRCVSTPAYFEILSRLFYFFICFKMCPSHLCPLPSLKSTNVALCWHLFTDNSRHNCTLFAFPSISENQTSGVWCPWQSKDLPIPCAWASKSLFLSHLGSVLYKFPIAIASAKTWTRIRHLLNGQGKWDQRT